MITCNRCGNVAPAGAVHCQRCGAPLSNKVESRVENPNPNPNPNPYNQQGMGGQAQGGQSELPAWLESLRVGERQAAPAKTPSSFSGRDLIEEGSLPSWMRPEQGTGGNQPVPSESRSDSFPGLNTGANTDESTLAAKGFTARSLIDEQALPSWMKEGSGSGGAAETPAPGGIAASSLVQQDAMPDWMKNLQQPPASQARPVQPPSSGYPGAKSTSISGMHPAQSAPPISPVPSPRPPSSGYPGTNSAPISGVHPAQSAPLPAPQRPTQSEPLVAPQGFSARDLIDQDALPSWMTPQGGAKPGATPNRAEASATPNRTNAYPGEPPVAPPAQGFSAHDLIDQDSLPSWMAPQGGAEASATPNKTNAVPGGQPEQAGFSASSLLDIDALPPWLRENGQQQNKGASAPSQSTPAAQGWQGGSFPASNMPQQQNTPWQGPSPAQPGNNVPASGISASSFIDANALPEWLRSAAEPQQAGASPQQGSMGIPPRPGAYGGPPRVENVRVPSRPRGEVNQPEGSEVAANVFASMLGVASAAPNFPASPMPSPSPASPMSSSQPAWPPIPQVQPGASPMASMPPATNIPGTPQPGMVPQQQAQQDYLGVSGGSYPGNQNSYAMGNPPMGTPQIPASGPGMPPVPGAAGQTGEAQPGMKPAKRGLFNAIREWFFR